MAEQWRALPSWVRIIAWSLAAFLTSIASISAGIATIEPWIPTHRQMTRDLLNQEQMRATEALAIHVAETNRIIAPTKIGMYDIQIRIAQSRRSELNGQIFKAEIEVPKSDSTDELVKRRQQLQTMRDELTDIESEIKVLRIQRDKN